MVIKQDRVTKSELMEFEFLETRDYRLPTEYAINCLQSTKSQLKRTEGRVFKMIRTGVPLTIRITRLK